MKRTHDISIWPLVAERPAQAPILTCTTQREAIKLFELLDHDTCHLLTGQRGPYRVRLTTHTGRQPSYHLDACTC